MTRQETTGVRDLAMSQWVRDKLPDSKTGFYTVTDLDFILYNYKYKKLMLVEVKTRKGRMSFSQRETLTLLDKIVKEGSITSGIKYYGFHCIRFESTCFADGRCMFDDKLISETELIKTLSMVDHA